MKYGIILFAFSVFIVTLIASVGMIYERRKDKMVKLPDENLLDEDKAFNPRNYGNNNISNK